MYYVQFLEGPLTNTWAYVDREDIQPTHKIITAANEDEYRNRHAVVEVNRCKLGSKMSLHFERECPGCGCVMATGGRILLEKPAIVAKIRGLYERIKGGQFKQGGHLVIHGNFCTKCHKSAENNTKICENCGNKCRWGRPPACLPSYSGIAKWTARTRWKSREAVMMMPCQHETRVYEKASLCRSILDNLCGAILPKRYLPEPPCQRCCQDGGTVQEFFDQQLQEFFRQDLREAQKLKSAQELSAIRAGPAPVAPQSDAPTDTNDATRSSQDTSTETRISTESDSESSETSQTDVEDVAFAVQMANIQGLWPHYSPERRSELEGTLR